MENVYQDLVYFGYDYEDDSLSLQGEFKKEIAEEFPGVEFKDAYDSIKGYRQEVYLPEEDKEKYQVWVLAYGWYEFSMKLSLMMMGGEHKDEVKRLIDLAKELYPEQLK